MLLLNEFLLEKRQPIANSQKVCFVSFSLHRHIYYQVTDRFIRTSRQRKEFWQFNLMLLFLKDSNIKCENFQFPLLQFFSCLAFDLFLRFFTLQNICHLSLYVCTVISHGNLNTQFLIVWTMQICFIVSCFKTSALSCNQFCNNLDYF